MTALHEYIEREQRERQKDWETNRRALEAIIQDEIPAQVLAEATITYDERGNRATMLFTGYRPIYVGYQLDIDGIFGMLRFCVCNERHELFKIEHNLVDALVPTTPPEPAVATDEPGPPISRP